MSRCSYCSKEFSNKGALLSHKKGCEVLHINQERILQKYKEGCSIRNLCNEYHIGTTIIRELLNSEKLLRGPSESAILAHKKYPESYFVKESTKRKLRQARLQWMKDNPEKTAWRTRNEPSYPEKLFMEICEKNNLVKDFDIIREYSVFPYYIDFAFLNARVAVEIDGSQHWREAKRKRNDLKKGEHLKKEGWRVMRIPEFLLKKQPTRVLTDLLDFLKTDLLEKKQYIEEIIHYDSLKEAKEREEKNQVKQRKLNRKRALLQSVTSRREDFLKEYPIPGWTTVLSKKWNMTPQATGRFCKRYYGIGTKHVAVTKDELSRLIGQKLTTKEISSILRLDTTTVLDYCRRHGVTAPEVVYKIRWSEVDLFSMLNQCDFNYSKVAQLLEVTPRSVTNQAKKMGIYKQRKDKK